MRYEIESPMSRGNRSEAGFTLIELLITTIVFTVIAGAAFTLIAEHQPIFKQQQNQAALNIAMRNAIAQMQIDIVNGGAGYYTGINVPNWPVGVVINNNVVGSTEDCHSGTTYGANCFDSFTVIASDPAITPVNIQGDQTSDLPAVAGSTTVNTDTNVNTTIYVLPPTGITAADYAASFYDGDQILLVKNDGSRYTTVQLTADATTATVATFTYVVLTHSALTNADGTNSAANDATGMSVHSSDQTTSQFAPQDWVVRLKPIKYDVDVTTDADNPTLRRTELEKGQTPDANGIALVNQVIGFKVGASLIDNTGSTPPGTYNFDSSTFKMTPDPPSPAPPLSGYDYTMVRSVMVSLVGRTAPRAPDVDTSYVFRNSFDGGPYQIQGVSVVINPRNMSM